jgi:hypothetical protein
LIASDLTIGGWPALPSARAYTIPKCMPVGVLGVVEENPNASEVPWALAGVAIISVLSSGALQAPRRRRILE